MAPASRRPARISSHRSRVSNGPTSHHFGGIVLANTKNPHARATRVRVKACPPEHEPSSRTRRRQDPAEEPLSADARVGPRPRIWWQWRPIHESGERKLNWLEPGAGLEPATC